MPNMELINKVTVGSGGAATISFTSIPQTYTDLVLQISTRTDEAGANWSEGRITFNGSSSGYTNRYLVGTGSAVASGNFSGAFVYGGRGTAAAATANTFGNSFVYIPNYTSSNNKSVSTDEVTENNATAALAFLNAGLWSNSAAITSITIVPNAGNFVQYSTAYLYGVSNVTASAKATGGTITSDGVYFYHTFTSSGTFTPTQSLTCDYLVVAGGGGGRGDRGGGGGAGGLRCTVGATGGGGSLETPLSLTAQAYTVTIGAGGAGGSSGSNSVFSTITSTGGGRGGYFDNNQPATGGSGGGGIGFIGTTTGAAGTTNQGYAGGTGADTGAGGGGGAGAVGAAGSAGSGSGGTGGVGGAGVTTSISGISTTYAGGGGGYGGLTRGLGGSGGGGNGSQATGSLNNTAGAVNTGGGAGGGHGSMSESGGSGIVIVRYAV